MKKEYSLLGVDSNAFSVMGYVESCMREEGKEETEIGDYRKSAMSGDYNELLCVSMDVLEELINE